MTNTNNVMGSRMHTKTPISVQENGQILNSDGIIIGKLSIPHCYKELPEHIVNCVNSHDAIVVALKEALDRIEYVQKAFKGQSGYGVRDSTIEKIKKTLEAAGVTV